MNNKDLKIVSCRITDQPKSFFDPMPQVWVTLENETKEQFLFEYYPDEISFTPSEFIGLTMNEGVQLKYLKDKKFLTTWTKSTILSGKNLLIKIGV